MVFDGLDQTALENLARRVSDVLRPGDAVVLSGEVGAGKTTFVRAAALALGVRERVTSPTYQFARGYAGRADGHPVTVNHLDLYRLDGLEAEDVLEFEDYLRPDAVTFVEWAEPVLGVLQNPTTIRLDHETPTTRRAGIKGPAAGRLGRC